MTDRDKNMLKLLAVVAVCAALWFGYTSGYQGYQQMGIELTQKQKQFKKAKAEALHLEQILANLKTIKEQLEDSKRRLPQKEKENEMLQRISTIFTQSITQPQEEKIINISQGTARAVGGGIYKVKSIPLSIKVNFESLKKLLRNFYNNELILDIESMMLSPPEKDKNIFKVTLHTNTYIYSKGGK